MIGRKQGKEERERSKYIGKNRIVFLQAQRGKMHTFATLRG